MPQPTAQDVHEDALLTIALIAYMNAPEAYIADTIFPIVPVRKQSGHIPEYTKEDWFRDLADLRAPATESKGSGFAVKKQTYFSDNYATHINVDDESRDNQDDPYDLDDAATRLVSERLKIRREKAFAADFFTTGKWTPADITPGNLWDDYALSDPISDLEDGKTFIHAKTGREPNDLTIGREVWVKLKHHPDFIERIKYTRVAIVTTGLVASLLELGRVMIGRAIEVTSAEGAASTVFSYIFGKDALLTFSPGRPGLMIPTAGYTFVWNKRGGIAFTRRIRDDKAMYDRIEGHTFFDQKILGADLGQFYSGVIS